MNAWIFDVDGVITDPIHKTTEKKILSFIIKILEKGDFVALNTGRSFSWTLEKVLSPLLRMTTNQELFKNMFVVCEKGNVLAQFQNVSWQKKLLDFPLPEDLQKKMKTLAQEFKDSLFYDTSKETMITFEMHAGFDTKKFEEVVKNLHAKIEHILIASYHPLELRVDPSHIALDIQYEDAGKHLGAERIEDFMIESTIKPDTIYMFGDSNSDSEMAEELQNKYKVIFIYVGERQKLDTSKLSCEIIFPAKPFDHGTLEYLSSHV